MLSNREYSRQDFIKMVTDAFDSLQQGTRNAYSLGEKLAKEKGKRIKQLVQEANALVSSYISDVLVELFYPLLLEEHETYNEIRKRCFSDFVAGVVKAS